MKANSEAGKDLEWIAWVIPRAELADGWENQMKTQFSFGKNGIEVSVPEGFDCRVIRSRTGVALKDVDAALGAALDNPIGCEPLAAMAAGKKTAAISVCDITRHARTGLRCRRC